MTRTSHRTSHRTAAAYLRECAAAEARVGLLTTADTLHQIADALEREPCSLPTYSIRSEAMAVCDRLEEGDVCVFHVAIRAEAAELQVPFAHLKRALGLYGIKQARVWKSGDHVHVSALAMRRVAVVACTRAANLTDSDRAIMAALGWTGEDVPERAR